MPTLLADGCTQDIRNFQNAECQTVAMDPAFLVITNGLPFLLGHGSHVDHVFLEISEKSRTFKCLEFCNDSNRDFDNQDIVNQATSMDISVHLVLAHQDLRHKFWVEHGRKCHFEGCW